MSKQASRILLSLAEGASVVGILCGIAAILLIYVVLVYVVVVYVTVRFGLTGTPKALALVAIIGAAYALWQFKGLGWARKGFAQLSRVAAYFDAKRSALDAAEGRTRS